MADYNVTDVVDVPTSAHTPEAIRAWLVERVAGYLEQSPDEIDPDEPLIGYGLDSVYAFTLCGEIRRRLGLTVEPAAIWAADTLSAFGAHLVSLAAE